jgi:hypothetical protein
MFYLALVADFQRDSEGLLIALRGRAERRGELDNSINRQKKRPAKR